MIDFREFNNIVSLTSYFNTEEKCRQAIIESRWPDGDVICPHCGQHHCYKRGDGKYRCPCCLRNFSCLVGTIFHSTKLPLIYWFIGMYLISSHKKGVSSHQLARDLDVSQETAWCMLQKIRILYPQTDEMQFNGTVECDEVYIGGKEKWKHQAMRTPHTQGRSTKTKTPVFGMVHRTKILNKHGQLEDMSYVRAFVVGNTAKENLLPVIEQFVAKGSRIMTDELNAYHSLTEMGYRHGIVRHGMEEYVNSDVFTNSVEGFWSHFRRMITGCYHNVSVEHLQSYVDEAVFRWNTRKMSESERFAHMFEMSIGIVVTWEGLKLCKLAG